MKKIIYFLILAIAASCGTPSESPKASLINPDQNSLEKPIKVSKDPQACAETIVDSNFSTQLFLYKNGLGGFFQVFLPWEKLFQKSIISEIKYHGKFEEIFKEDLVLKIEEEAPRDLDLCPSESSKRNTIESVAYNTSYYIIKTHDYFLKHTKIKVPPISLLLLPEIKKKVKIAENLQSTYLTDNAFYRPFSASITFLPHSEEAKNKGLIMNFWEIPFIPSHEYGHHIFRKLFPYQESIYSGVNFKCFDHQIFLSNAEKPLKRKVSINEVLNFINEAFSDLLASYALDEDENKLDGIPCIEVNRDISRPFFVDGTAKVISQQALYDFFYAKKLFPISNCQVTNFQSIHTFGALFAYNLNNFMSLFTKDKDKKLKIMTTWISMLKYYHKDLASLPPKKYFDSTFTLFLRLTTTHFDKTFDQNICNAIEQIYPNFNRQFGECSSF